LFSSKFALAALIAAILALASAPLALSVNTNNGIIGAFGDDVEDDEYDHDDDDEDDDEDDDDYDHDYELVSVVGNVTAWVYDEDEDDDEDDDEEQAGKMRPDYFVIDNETYVEFGPWWYWSVGTPNVTSVVRLNDSVNVTGEIVHEDDMTIICAWIIENLTTGEKLTIKGEGAPSWAGGPKAFGIDPWPPY